MIILILQVPLLNSLSIIKNSVKIIKSYTQASSLNLFSSSSKKVLFSLYSATRENFKYWLIQRKNKKISLSKKQKLLLQLLKNKSSVWLDGFGFGLKHLNNKIISIENSNFKPLLNKIPHNNCIYFSKNIYSNTSLNLINKKIMSDIIIIDYEKTSYTTTSELTKFLHDLHNIFKARKLIVCVDLRKIDFNKLKFTYNEIIEGILKNLNIKNKSHAISMLEHVLELN